MATYYNSNALYDFIQKNNVPGFFFAKENLWMMVYGDKDCNPKLLVTISAVVRDSYSKRLVTQSEEKAARIMEKLSQATEIPFYAIRYDVDDSSLNALQLMDINKRTIQDISQENLVSLYKNAGFIVNSNGAGKYLNDKTSSAFHDWQRRCLGNQMVACDMDLLRISNSENVEAIYELKRSYISLESWTPYRDDFLNFKLISNMANLAGAKYRIVYNVRTKNPFFDDIRRLKTFTFEPEGRGEAKFEKYTTPTEFFGY